MRCIEVCCFFTESADDCSCSEVIEESLRLLSPVSDRIPVTMVTLGRHGVLLCSRGDFIIGKGSCVQVQ
ncbi:hypothetical protein DPMN_155952 [Dreissena polymorpha]|uniref:Uncharacterized protein n=1 Tax=Dreissena polymorpha TaxID=45954 RepID=A0A9D4JAD9_DREPO|nr:hypothetical protein DPMN_155952 [Dreissena polymorpha]